MDIDRRKILLGGAAASLLPPAIAQALTIDATVRTGTLKDVEHVVIFMQENRAFDHYFGGLNGVRGFGDRFPIPVPDAPGRVRKTAWLQLNGTERNGPPLISPFPLNTTTNFSHMRVEGTPHGWDDAQFAWDEGRMSHWPKFKTEHSMGYFQKQDIPFQYALAEAFTLCDAYHCAIHTGTNSNRLFLWSGTNDPSGKLGGPSITNSHDRFASQGGDPDSYRWTVYAERLLQAGVTWRIYQDMADNFTDNPVAGFKTFRDSYDKKPGSDPRLAELGLSTRALDGLRQDVMDGTLPQVSYVVAPAKASEHPGPSSPAQGADYTAHVIEALTANPKVWSKTVLLLMFDENDGFFDHVPPSAPPSLDKDGAPLGGSTVDTAGEYHTATTHSEEKAERPALMGRPYGLGPRVPLYVISPWSRGGWVNSEVFDHTSVIRFLEQRFGVMEPNISPWRRAVCGDLTSAFNFRTPNAVFPADLPDTKAVAARAAALPGRATPVTPAQPEVPVQAAGPRLSRALPYVLNVAETRESGAIRLTFRNDGRAAAVFHVYDRHRLDRAPHRYTVEPGKALDGLWDAGAYDLWVLAPGGFHRHLIGDASRPEPTIAVAYDVGLGVLKMTVANPAGPALTLKATPGAYGMKPWRAAVAAGGGARQHWRVAASRGWYDMIVRVDGPSPYLRRLAGRLETGADSISDPAMGGPAVLDQAPYA
ncbi:MAG: phospholipase C, phosphocholine-specific [Caulobacteraceae bacterium]